MTAVVTNAATWWPSRYGIDDQAGALNEIGSDNVVGAARLVRQGRVYDLAHVLHMDVPAFEGRMFCQELDSPQSVPGPHGLGFVIERVHAPSQMGTHLDPLNHLHKDGRTYNGHHVADITAPYGTTKLGADTLPQIVTRGLLVDVAAHRGVARLDAGDVIIPDDLAGVDVRPGDAVLFHTGWASCGTRTRTATGRVSPARAWRWPTGWPTIGSPSRVATRGATGRCRPSTPTSPSSSPRPSTPATA
jgi:kynurenine formamidase